MIVSFQLRPTPPPKKKVLHLCCIFLHFSFSFFRVLKICFVWPQLLLRFLVTFLQKKKNLSGPWEGAPVRLLFPLLFLFMFVHVCSYFFIFHLNCIFDFFLFIVVHFCSIFINIAFVIMFNFFDFCFFVHFLHFYSKKSSFFPKSFFWPQLVHDFL